MRPRSPRFARTPASGGREGDWDRTLRRANKIIQPLAADPRSAALFPPKPKGMWRRTYARLRARTFDAETRAEEAFALHTEGLLARIDQGNRTRRNRKRSFWE